MYGLSHRGWGVNRSGRLQRRVAPDCTVLVECRPGLDHRSVEQPQRLGRLVLTHRRNENVPIRFSDVDPVAMSELIRELDRLADCGPARWSCRLVGTGRE